MSAEFVTAAYISSSQIIGGDIYSDNYSINAANCRVCGYIGNFEKITKERTDENGDIIYDGNGNPYYDTVYICPECGEENTRKVGSGSHINLRDGTLSFGGGALKFENGKLIISSNKADSNVTELNDEWLKTTSVYAENLWVNSANVSGKLTANQIDASELKVNAAQIKGQLTVGQIEDGVTTIIGNTVTTGYIEALNINVDAANIDGKLTASQIDATNLKVDAANITGTLTIGTLPDNVATTNQIPQFTSQLINNSGYQDATGVTQIVGGVVTTDYVNALGISASVLQGNEISIIGPSYTNGQPDYNWDGTIMKVPYVCWNKFNWYNSIRVAW